MLIFNFYLINTDIYSKFKKLNKSKLDGNIISRKVSFNEFPVNQVAEVLYILGSGVSVVNVVSMFPNVNC